MKRTYVLMTMMIMRCLNRNRCRLEGIGISVKDFEEKIRRKWKRLCQSMWWKDIYLYKRNIGVNCQSVFSPLQVTIFFFHIQVTKTDDKLNIVFFFKTINASKQTTWNSLKSLQNSFILRDHNINLKLITISLSTFHTVTFFWGQIFLEGNEKQFQFSIE